MVSEWLDAIQTVNWLLGASMAFAGRKLLAWLEASVETVKNLRDDSKGESAKEEESTEDRRPHD